MCEGHAPCPNEWALTDVVNERREIAIRMHITEVTAVKSRIMLVIEGCCIPKLSFRVPDKSSMYCVRIPRKLRNT